MKPLLFIMACLTLHNVCAQPKEDDFYVFDKNWKGTDVKNGVYFSRVHQTKENNYVWLTYNMFGPRISELSYTGKEGKILNGQCFYYHANGMLDSSGNYVNGAPNGEWGFFNEEGRTIRVKNYDNGLVVKDTLYAGRKADTTAKNLPVPGEVESSFAGGPKGWAQYLNKNFTYPKRAESAKVSGRIVLQFIVDQSGKVQEPEIFKSAEYSLDEEALQIIRKSPNWVPASKDGKVLKSYKRQPISFQLP